MAYRDVGSWIKELDGRQQAVRGLLWIGHCFLTTIESGLPAKFQAEGRTEGEFDARSNTGFFGNADR